MNNRKKAILMLSGFEVAVTFILLVLFLNDAISMPLFVALLMTLCLVSSAVMFVIIRKLNKYREAY